jgi:lipoyl(octanoyl) transferase
VAYAEATVLQDSCARAVKDGRPDAERLLLLEHPPVITLGRNADPRDVLLSAGELRSMGVAVERCNRGGQVTYHGPGQLVGYPILDLQPDRLDVARYLRDLEETLIRTLRSFGVMAGRIPGLTGVWAGDAKIASLGVHLSRWVTTHGFALNVDPDLAHFDLIVPCGLRARGVTSMQRLLGRAPDLGAVAAAFAREFGELFGRAMVCAPAVPAPPPAIAEMPR